MRECYITVSNLTLTEFRSKYWVVEERCLVRSVIHKCVICRRFDGTPYYPPLSPPLSTFRMKEEPLFTYDADGDTKMTLLTLTKSKIPQQDTQEILEKMEERIPPGVE